MTELAIAVEPLVRNVRARAVGANPGRLRDMNDVDDACDDEGDDDDCPSEEDADAENADDLGVADEDVKVPPCFLPTQWEHLSAMGTRPSIQTRSSPPLTSTEVVWPYNSYDEIPDDPLRVNTG